MQAYKVSYWFGNANGKADQVAYVETDSKDKQEIKRQAHIQVSSRVKIPMHYQVLVEPVDALETYYVIKIKLDDAPPTTAWYKHRDEELVVVYRDKKGNYITAHSLDESSTYGIIKPEYCQIITSFKVEDTY